MMFWASFLVLLGNTYMEIYLTHTYYSLYNVPISQTTGQSRWSPSYDHVYYNGFCFMFTSVICFLFFLFGLSINHSVIISSAPWVSQQMSGSESLLIFL